MSRPAFTIKRISDECIDLYSLKIHGKTIAQLQLDSNIILLYPFDSPIKIVMMPKPKEFANE